jgi:purine catabolism regulator
MLTVREALELSVFEGARVVAGMAGLDRRFNWVHNVGVPDAARWLTGGEFVLTTGLNMPSQPDAQADYLRAMIDKGVVALGISVGQYLAAIPQNLRAIADAHDFPLVEVPYDLFYVQIARHINRLIAQYDLRRALDIQQTLTRLVLEGGGIKDLAATMAALVQQSVSIESEHFEAYASVNIGAVDEARRYTQKHGRTDPRLVQALRERGYLPEIQRTLRPVNLPQMPDVGLEMERILAPIVVHGEIIGFMWLIADDRPLGDLDRMAIEAGATVAALLLLRQDAVQREEAAQRGDLLTGLIESTSVRPDVLVDRALRYGLDLRQPFRVLVVDPGERPLAPRQHQKLAADIDALKLPVIVGRFSGLMVLLLQAATDPEPLLRRLTHLPDGARIGLSAPQRGAAAVSQGFSEAQEALLVMGRVDRAARVVYFDRLGYLYTLYRAGAGALDSSPYCAALRGLRADRGGELFDTLEGYLDAGGNGVAAAEALHVHRSTLNYRLARISDLCGVDLSDPHTRLDLLVAVKLIRLFDA